MNGIDLKGLLHVLRPCEQPIDVEGPDGKPVTLIQVFDDKALKSMLNRFTEEAAAPGFEGMLIDFDHFSEDTTKPTEAAGWAFKMVNRDEGLHVDSPDWSDLGETAVKGKRYKFASVAIRPEDCEYLGNRRVRPLRIDRIALTNDPRVKGLKAFASAFKNRALLNRAEHGDNFAGTKSAGAPGASGTDGGIRMKSVLKELGLAENAEESAVLSAVQALKNRATSAATAATEHQTVTQERDTLKLENTRLTNRVTELEKADLDAQVEKDLETHKGKFTNRDEAKALLSNKATRDATLKAFALMPAGGKVLNRDGAKAPEMKTSEEDVEKQTEFVDKVQRQHKLTNRSDAFSLARTLKPELFVVKP